MIPIDAVLAHPPIADDTGESIGHSRLGRPMRGHRFGVGLRHVSLIAGCHADEPVGPAMLRRLCGLLAETAADAPLLRDYRWFVVPDANPDGAVRNRSWSEHTVECRDHAGQADRGFALSTYVERVVRELPGDDIEFGFPRHAADLQARPENRAIAAFLAPGAPYRLHASFHGMDFAVGPWFLIEASWAERTRAMRSRLRAAVRTLGYRLFDPDRGGEKGFHRIDEGFTTRPDSRAMRAHFEALGDSATAELFRPSSMEYVRGLGGDPFTLVSEMPLFLLEPGDGRPATPTSPESRERFHTWIRTASDRGVAPMPIRDQMRLQLTFLDEALEAAA